MSSEGDHVGGLVGVSSADAEIRRSYATGDVSGSSFVGGFVGRQEYSGSVVGAFSTGAVSGDSNVGGFAGRHRQEVADVYWDRGASGTDDAAGTVTGGAQGEITGLSTAEMTGVDASENLDGLDFSNTFHTTDEYPVFRSEITGGDLELENDAVGEGQTMDATVTLTLRTGATVTASEVASYDSETAVAEVDSGTLTANSEGVTEVTASVAGYSDTAEVEVLEPPEISLLNAELAAEGVVNGSEALVTATYENTGGPGSHGAAVTVDGEEVTSESLRVEPDSERTVEFTWTPDSGGLVSLDDTDPGSLEIVDREATVSVQPSVLEYSGLEDGAAVVVSVVDGDGEPIETGRVRVESGSAQLVEPQVATVGNGTAVWREHDGDPAELAANEVGFVFGDTGSDTGVSLGTHRDQGTLAVHVEPPAEAEYVDEESNPTVEVIDA